MAIDMETGEWFSMGALMEGMTPAERQRYLEDTHSALTGAIETLESGGTPDIKAVNRVVTGSKQIDESISALDPDREQRQPEPNRQQTQLPSGQSKTNAVMAFFARFFRRR
jgi:hypothetical protein